MENKKQFETTIGEVTVLFLDSEEREHRYGAELSDEEVLQVMEVLEANPKAKFEDIPAELYHRIEQEIVDHCIDEGHDCAKIQQNMPDDIMEMYEEYKAFLEAEEVTEETETTCGGKVVYMKDENLDSTNTTILIETSDKEEYEKAVAEYKATGKSIITLQLKGEFFDQIVSGEKTQEFREITEKNEKKFIQMMLEQKTDEEGNPMYDKNGQPIMGEYGQLDENGNSIPKHYDAIQFLNGYNADRRCMLIEIESAESAVIVDEDGNDYSYITESGDDFLPEMLTYNLGQIIVLKHKG